MEELHAIKLSQFFISGKEANTLVLPIAPLMAFVAIS
jgi:hypothetical protein